MVPRIKESRGTPGTPPCGFFWEEKAHGGPIFSAQQAKHREIWHLLPSFRIITFEQKPPKYTSI